jgi:hypothetical protein
MDDDDAPSTAWPLGAPAPDLLPAVGAACGLWLAGAVVAAVLRRLLPPASAKAGAAATATSPSPPRRPGSGRYGLTGDDDDEDDDDGDRFASCSRSPSAAPPGPPTRRSSTPPSTARFVGELQRTPDYAAYLRSRGLTYRDVAASKRRLDLYRDLRANDAAAFRALLPAPPPPSFDTLPAPRLALLADWAAGGGAGAVAGLLTVWPLGVPPAVRAAAAAAWLASLVAALRCRSAVPGLWWEDGATGVRPRGARPAAALIVDAVYGAATLGVGAVVTAVARATTRASLGDRLVGVRLVRERRGRVEVG